MLVQKGKIFLGSDVKIISDKLILNNNRYDNSTVEPVPPQPINVDSYDLVSKTMLTGSTINYSINTLPLKVNSVSQVSPSGAWVFTLAANLQEDDICICIPQSAYSSSDTTYTLNPAVINKYDSNRLITSFNQVRIEMRTIKNTGLVQQSLTLTTIKYCLLIYRKKTEVVFI